MFALSFMASDNQSLALTELQYARLSETTPETPPPGFLTIPEAGWFGEAGYARMRFDEQHLFQLELLCIACSSP